MLLHLHPQSTEEDIRETLSWLAAHNNEPVYLPGAGSGRIVLLAPNPDCREQFGLLPGVCKATPLFSPYKLAGRESCPDDTIITVGRIQIGGGEPVVMAGPCAVESREQTRLAAQMAKEAGAQILRGGAYKPRTSPYTFQGLGRAGLEILAEVGRELGLPTITEVITPEDVPEVAQYVDVLQIGARNMQNFALLSAAGESGKPVMLKRGLAATIEEWLLAAEYILRTGNRQVILCERGIRTFEPATRNTLDLSAVALARALTHLPVVVDPSHGTGRPELIIPMARAAIAAGAHGVMVEIHPDPCSAKCDGSQALNLTELKTLVYEVNATGKLMASLATERMEKR